MTNRRGATLTSEREQTDGRKADKQQAIIEAARDLFTGTGYEQTTIADVARRAGVAVGTVYLYFKSKPDLLCAVKGGWELELLAFLGQLDLEGIPYQRRARPIVTACFDLCARQTQMVQLMGLQPQQLGEWKAQDEAGIQQAVQVFFEQAIAAGAFRPMDSRIAAVLAYGMVETALQQCFMIEEGRNQQQYIDALVDALEHWLARPDQLANES